MTIEEIYDWDLTHTAHEVFGTTDERHPLKLKCTARQNETSPAASVSCACPLISTFASCV